VAAAAIGARKAPVVSGVERMIGAPGVVTQTLDPLGYVRVQGHIWRATLAHGLGTEIEYETIAPGGFSLEDHWNAGQVPAEIATSKWDAVVMQQGPSALPESQVNLREWAERLAPCRLSLTECR